jgi:hypothetical protein
LKVSDDQYKKGIEFSALYQKHPQKTRLLIRVDFIRVEILKSTPL